MANTDFIKTSQIPAVTSETGISDNDRVVGVHGGTSTVAMSVYALKKKIVESNENDARIRAVSFTPASKSSFGAVMIGDGIDVENGIISVRSLYTDLIKVLEAGQTEISFTSDVISSTMDVTIFTNVFGVNPKTIAVNDHTLTLTFASQQTDLYVKARIWT